MRHFIPLVILTLVLAACAVDPTPTTTPTPVPTPLPPTATALPLPTDTATAAFTRTSLPTATSAATSTPGSTATSAATSTPGSTPSGDPARGKELFHFYTCDSCHDVTNAGPAGFYAPNLGNISQEAERIIQLPEYKGTAKTPAEYIRESVMNPNVYLVPGALFLDSPGVSAMVQEFSEQIPPADLDDIIAYLLTLHVE